MPLLPFEPPAPPPLFPSCRAPAAAAPLELDPFDRLVGGPSLRIFKVAAGPFLRGKGDPDSGGTRASVTGRLGTAEV